MTIITCPTTTKGLSHLIVNHCSHNILSELRNVWSQQIEDIAYKYSIDSNLVWLQVCLHAPLYSKEQLFKETDMPKSLLTTVRARLDKYSDKYRLFMERCGAFLLQNYIEEMAIEKKKIRLDIRNSISFRLAPVDDDSGAFIESNLHYLHSTNPNTVHRYGMYLDGYDLPICYASVAIIDRQYKLNSLSAILSDEVKSEHVLDIARIYGFGHLPKNSISVLLSYVTKQLSRFNVKYVVTAVNPMLGFSGISMLASGFKPYALCPVAYGYCENGFYRTRRQNQIQSAQLKTPPNVLFVRGFKKASRRRVENINSLFIISSQLHQESLTIMSNNKKQTRVIDTLETLRTDLEKAWNSITRYHRISYEPDDPISKGQCGVTSAYLAQRLQEDGYDVLFCEGNVKFPDGTPPITKHCWVTIPKLDDKSPEINDLLIDLTADQSGYSESVICDTRQNLLSRGIVYEELRQVEPRIVEAGHLLSRLNSLQERLEKFVSTQGKICP